MQDCRAHVDENERIRDVSDILGSYNGQRSFVNERLLFASTGEDLVRWSGVELACASSECECPSAFVGGVVMSRAQGHHVVEVCRPAMFPILDVVDLAGVKRDGASVERAGVMGGFERTPLSC